MNNNLFEVKRERVKKTMKIIDCKYTNRWSMCFGHNGKYIDESNWKKNLSTNECEWCGGQTYCVCAIERGHTLIQLLLFVLFLSNIFHKLLFQEEWKKPVIKLNDDILKIESNIEKSNTHTQSFLYVSLNIDDDNQWWFWNI